MSQQVWVPLSPCVHLQSPVRNRLPPSRWYLPESEYSNETHASSGLKIVYPLGWGYAMSRDVAEAANGLVQEWRAEPST